MSLDDPLSQNRADRDPPANFETIMEGDNLSEYWDKVINNASNMHDKYPYNPFTQNSNTFADNVLKNSGLPVPKQGGYGLLGACFR